MMGGRGVRFWAWTASVGAHVVLLTTFAVVKVSSSKAESQRVIPAARIGAVQRMMESQPAIPKPKVTAPGRGRVIASTRPAVSGVEPSRVVEIVKPAANEQPDETQTHKVQEEMSPTVDKVLQAETEFFGSRTDERRICYVVDCSGSMAGLWQRVRGELAESIGGLQPDEYFCVIVFGGDRILESGSGILMRATEQAKKEAYGFIDSMRPAGTTNAVAAMERAVKVRDAGGIGPGLIYFLTDGFELGEEDAGRFGDRISVMLRSFTPKTKVNTIGFWPEEQDRKLLERIAKQSGGDCTIIGEGAKGDVWDEL
jgi:Mg-chelatase subunit ChlD